MRNYSSVFIASPAVKLCSSHNIEERRLIFFVFLPLPHALGGAMILGSESQTFSCEPTPITCDDEVQSFVSSSVRGLVLFNNYNTLGYLNVQVFHYNSD